MRSRERAFTMIELLFVTLLIMILAALLLPALEKARAQARRVECVSQLRQIGLAFQSFSHDHNSEFPMKVSTNAGGSKEFVEAANLVGGDFYFAYRHFQALSNYLVRAPVLKCPVDRRRNAATNFADLQNENVSYLINAQAEPGNSQSLLAADANLVQTGARVQTGRGRPLEWNREQHHFAGNVLFGDGHVERWNNATLAAATGSDRGGSVLLPVPAPQPSPNTGGKPPGQGKSNSEPPGVLGQLEGIGRRGAASRIEPSGEVAVEATRRNIPARATNPATTAPRREPAQPSLGVAEPARELPVVEPLPRRVSEYLTRTGQWPLYALVLLLIAGLLAFELLRRHRLRG